MVTNQIGPSDGFGLPLSSCHRSRLMLVDLLGELPVSGVVGVSSTEKENVKRETRERLLPDLRTDVPIVLPPPSGRQLEVLLRQTDLQRRVKDRRSGEFSSWPILWRLNEPVDSSVGRWSSIVRERWFDSRRSRRRWRDLLLSVARANLVREWPNPTRSSRESPPEGNISCLSRCSSLFPATSRWWSELCRTTDRDDRDETSKTLRWPADGSTRSVCRCTTARRWRRECCFEARRRNCREEERERESETYFWFEIVEILSDVFQSADDLSGGLRRGFQLFELATHFQEILFSHLSTQTVQFVDVMTAGLRLGQRFPAWTDLLHRSLARFLRLTSDDWWPCPTTVCNVERERRPRSVWPSVIPSWTSNPTREKRDRTRRELFDVLSRWRDESSPVDSSLPAGKWCLPIHWPLARRAWCVPKEGSSRRCHRRPDWSVAWWNNWRCPPDRRTCCRSCQCWSRTRWSTRVRRTSRRREKRRAVCISFSIDRAAPGSGRNWKSLRSAHSEFRRESFAVRRRFGLGTKHLRPASRDRLEQRRKTFPTDFAGVQLVQGGGNLGELSRGAVEIDPTRTEGREKA